MNVRRVKKPVVRCIKGLSSKLYGAAREDVDTAYTAVMERLVYHVLNGVPVRPIDPGPLMVKTRLAATERKFRQLASFIAPLTFSQFLETVRGRKRRLYENAILSLLAGYNAYEVTNWAKVRAFLKFEKLLVYDPDQGYVRKVPRIIQPRDPRYNVLVGRYTKAIEHRVYQDIAKLFEDDLPVVAKGMNSWQLGEIIAEKWKRFKKPVCVGFDQNRFDQHISKSVLEFEHHIYQKYCHSKELALLLKKQLRTKGKMLCFNGIVRYTSVSRCSGDMNTGLGNSLLQAAMIHSFIEGTPFSQKPAVLVNGDDSFIMCEETDLSLLAPFPAFCADLGFVLAVEAPVYELEKVSFCQMCPIFNGRQYAMMRNWPNCVSKDTHLTLQVTPNNFQAYFATVGEAGLALHSGVPVLQSFYQFLMRHSTERLAPLEEEGGIHYWRKNLESKSFQITDRSRVSFWHATGVLPEHQESIEAWYESLAPAIWGNDPLSIGFQNAEWGLGQGVSSSNDPKSVVGIVLKILTSIFPC